MVRNDALHAVYTMVAERLPSRRIRYLIARGSCRGKCRGRHCAIAVAVFLGGVHFVGSFKEQ